VLAANDSILALIWGADFIVQLVLLGLVFMSVVCWGIILYKAFVLRAAGRQSARFLEVFWASKRLDAVYEKAGSFRGSPVAEVFRAGYQELAKITAAAEDSPARADATDNLARTLRRATAVESTSLESYVTFLGTTASSAPFIGLFGTVWGILRAFQKLGTSGRATIDVVGPDIAHALIATAVGLAAAIPAVIAFNYFHASIRVINTEMENFSADFLNIVKRHVR
jgi:biopolymer transport protein TolQ